MGLNLKCIDCAKRKQARSPRHRLSGSIVILEKANFRDRSSSVATWVWGEMKVHSKSKNRLLVGWASSASQ